MKAWEATCRILGLGAVVVFLVTAFTPLVNHLSRALAMAPRLERADAIVVLGASLQPDGTLNGSGLSRTIAGFRLLRRGLAPLVVLLGPPRADGRSEAEARAALARELGIPAMAVLPLASARTTREEALHVAAALHPRGIRRILLVSDSLHLGRGTRLFAHAGFEVLPAPVDVLSSAADAPEERLALLRGLLQELLARLYYRLAGYL